MQQNIEDSKALTNYQKNFKRLFIKFKSLHSSKSTLRKTETNYKLANTLSWQRTSIKNIYTHTQKQNHFL